MYSIFRFALPACLTLITLLAACGGGGGGGGDAPVGVTPPAVTPPVDTPVVQNFSCWNGNITSTMALTKNNCAPVSTPVVAVGSNNYPTLTFAVGAIPTSGMVTATADTSTVVYGVSGGTVSLVSGTVSYSTMNQFTARVVYLNAPDSVWAGTYTTSAAPDWKDVIKTKVDAGIVNGALVNPSAVIRTWTATNPLTDRVRDVKFDSNLASGNIQTIFTNEVTLDVNGVQRKVGRYVYQAYSGANCILPFYVDTGEATVASQNTSGFGCFTGTAPTYVVGFNDVSDPAKGGVIYKDSISGTCNKVTNVRGSEQVPCPF
jgi:hypothetical protein